MSHWAYEWLLIYTVVMKNSAKNAVTTKELVVLNHFQKGDLLMAELFAAYLDSGKSHPIGRALPPDKYTFQLYEAIISQQLSVKAADTIFGRFVAHFSGRLTPEEVIRTDSETLRSLGLSYQKVSYIKAVAEAVATQKLKPELLPGMSDEEVTQVLTGIKGVGQWTAEMFLIFTLGREDVFSPGDGGLKRAVQKIYGNSFIDVKDQDSPDKKWAPYRSYACLSLWHSLE